MSEWRDIASAPKDGSEIILGDRYTVGAGFWSEGADYRRGEDGWFAEMDRGSLLTAKNMWPTHWQPLPAAPVIEAGTAETGTGSVREHKSTVTVGQAPIPTPLPITGRENT